MKNLIQISIALSIALSALVSLETNSGHAPNTNYISMDQSYIFENTSYEEILF